MMVPSRFLIAASLAICSALASAAPVTIFGEDTAPGAQVPAGSLAKAARDSFLGQFNGTVDSFGFERLTLLSGSGAAAVGQIDFTASTGTIGATLSGDGVVRTAPQLGRFNTTTGGSKYWEVQSGGTGSFSITFNSAIAGFGFYATDVNDFGGSFKLILESATFGDPNVELLISPTPLNDGNLVFFGFTDRVKTYTKVTFQTAGGTSTAPDFFGFDDFVIGDSGQLNPVVVPEPGTLALAGLALVGLACGRRRQQRVRA